MTWPTFAARHVKRWFRPTSLRYQLLSRALYILLGLLLLIGVFQYTFLRGFLYRNTVSTIVNEIHSVPPQLWRNWGNPGSYRSGHGGDGHPNPGSGGPEPHFSVPVTSIALIHSNNRLEILSEYSNHGKVTKLNDTTYESVMASGRQSWRIVKDAKGNQEILVLVPVESFSGPVGVIQASSPVGNIEAILTWLVVLFVVLGFLAFVGGALVFIPTIRRTLRPLSSMVEAVERVNAGNLEERFTPVNPQAEIEVLSGSFNEMLARIHTSFEKEREANEKMRQFIADASHELRTPLTSIHGFLEILLRGAANNPEQLKKSLRSMYGESERMNKLVEDLILLARLDQKPNFELIHAPMEILIHEMEPHLRVLAGNRTVTFHVEDSVVAFMDSDRMKQVVLNLFNNAVQHTDPATGVIELSLTASDEPNGRVAQEAGDYDASRVTRAASGPSGTTRPTELGGWSRVSGALLVVRDNGKGIAPEHLAHLFERFYRIDTSRARKDGGVGLGLSITQSIVERHGGRIWCESTVGTGTAFYVWIPA